MLVDYNNMFVVYVQVFYLHVVLGIQDLLRVRLHAAGVPHPGRRHRLCHHRLHLLPAQRRGLPMV